MRADARGSESARVQGSVRPASPSGSLRRRTGGRRRLPWEATKDGSGCGVSSRRAGWPPRRRSRPGSARAGSISPSCRSSRPCRFFAAARRGDAAADADADASAAVESATKRRPYARSSDRQFLTSVWCGKYRRTAYVVDVEELDGLVGRAGERGGRRAACSRAHIERVSPLEGVARGSSGGGATRGRCCLSHARIAGVPASPPPRTNGDACPAQVARKR